jgi:hypothetical protein
MHTFCSSKPLPYVYMGIHNISGAIYIGYREGNVKLNIPSSSDLGVHYFTSGKISATAFNEFTWTIIAEFFSPVDAYLFEQELIETHWDNPLLLNQQFYKGDGSAIFRHTGKTPGFTGHTHSAETKLYISNAISGAGNGMYGKTHSESSIALMSSKKIGANNPSYKRPVSQETREKLRKAATGKTKSAETRLKISNAARKRHRDL